MPDDNKPEVTRDKDSIQNILIVSLAICFVCAIVVSGAAVSLKPMQIANKALDRNKNILIAAGLFEKNVTPEAQIDELFKEFDTRVVDLQEQRFLTADEVTKAGIDVIRYDQRKASKDPAQSSVVPGDQDIASIKRRARYSVVYLLNKDDRIDRIVLPVHGYGLWSTLYGFVALEGDGRTVSGITFYEHGETAGLGGEVDNPAWKASWQGKQIYGPDGDVRLRVIKGSVDKSLPGAEYEIDGLSGATLTSKGVENLVGYWLGDTAFGPVLNKIGG